MFGAAAARALPGKMKTIVGQTRDSHGSTSGRNRLMLLPLDRFDSTPGIAARVIPQSAQITRPSQTKNYHANRTPADAIPRFRKSHTIA